MASEKLIRVVDILPNGVFFVNENNPLASVDELLGRIHNAPAVDAIPVDEIQAYLYARLDDWNALGDRKWDPPNMWGYNFIMACLYDMERRKRRG